eukprot:SAG11_NODE_3563_length_2369_cov_13.164317_2_plen_133_part_00
MRTFLEMAAQVEVSVVARGTIENTHAPRETEEAGRLYARKGGYGRTFARPGEVARVQAESAVLQVAAAAAHGVDALFTGQLGVSRLPTQVVLTLLAPLGLAASGKPALVDRVAVDTYDTAKVQSTGEATRLY